MCETNDEKTLNAFITQMIEKIANKQNVFFKSQQKDETDLTLTQKQSIVKNLLNDNKVLFLQRYGSVLSEEELNYFDKYAENQIISDLLKGFREDMTRNKSKSLVRNRRFEALKELIERGEYFSDSQMQTRNPLLFEEMIGQYMTDEEKTKLTNDKYFQNHERVTLSAFLLEQIDNNLIEDTLNEQKVEEFDSDDSEDQVSENEVEDEENNEIIPTKKSLEESEKLKLREEFNKYMTEQFLSGKDSEFYDYKQCDQNIDLDFNEINERDIEEKYFDDD